MNIQKDIQIAVAMYKEIQDGIKAIEKLGRFLAEKTKSYPTFLEEICIQHHSISYANLKQIEKVGRCEIYAPVLVSVSRSARRLLTFHYDDQKKLWEQGVKVAVPNQDNPSGFSVQCVKPDQLTYPQMRQVFIGQRTRTVAEQVKFIKFPGKKGTPKFVIQKTEIFFKRKAVIDRAEFLAIAEKFLSFTDVLELLNRLGPAEKVKKTA